MYRFGGIELIEDRGMDMLVKLGFTISDALSFIDAVNDTNIRNNVEDSLFWTNRDNVSISLVEL